MDDGWERLRSRHPWPGERPNATGRHAREIHGWLSNGTKAMIQRHLPSSGLVLELGTWMGKSAKMMMERAPEIRLMCVDHWEGSPEINTKHSEMLSDIFDFCQYHLWPYRDKIVLVRMKTIGGMMEIHKMRICPDMVYVDGAHDAKSVAGDVLSAGVLFPSAIQVGDDWGRESVRQGLATAAMQLQRQTAHNENAWVMEVA